MTTEQAIRILDPATRRETMKAIPVHNRIDTDQEACRLAVAALRAQKERENPKPLTLDELRQMYGEPVWVVESFPPFGEEWEAWDILEEIDGDSACFGRGVIGRLSSEDYNRRDSNGNLIPGGWLAYRNKPKEVQE